jgi:hypothetical protein
VRVLGEELGHRVGVGDGLGRGVPVLVTGVRKAVLGLIDDEAQCLGRGGVALCGLGEDALDLVAQGVDFLLVGGVGLAAGIRNSVGAGSPGDDEGAFTGVQYRQVLLLTARDGFVHLVAVADEFAAGITEDVGDGVRLGVGVREFACRLVDELALTPAQCALSALPLRFLSASVASVLSFFAMFCQSVIASSSWWKLP